MKSFFRSLLLNLKSPIKQIKASRAFKADSLLLSELPEAVLKPKSLLIIKTDDIGDYILFRDFLKPIRSQHQDYKISLIGNKAWKTLAEDLDGAYVDDFIWINKGDFMKNPVVRKQVVEEIRKGGFEKVIGASCSRNLYLEDFIAAATGAKQVVGANGKSNNSFNWQDRVASTIYSSLIPAVSNFEFYSNKVFFERLLEKRIDCQKPFMPFEAQNEFKQQYGNYVVLFPGGSFKSKRWHEDNFRKTGEYIASKYKLKVIIAGGPDEVPIGVKITQLFKSKDQPVDLTGKTNLLELGQLIKASKLLVTNDSCAIHMAGAMGVSAIALANGNNYGRFLPYPSEINPGIITIYPPAFEKKLKQTGLEKMFAWKGKTTINHIEVETVEKAVDAVLKK